MYVCYSMRILVTLLAAYVGFLVSQPLICESACSSEETISCCVKQDVCKMESTCSSDQECSDNESKSACKTQSANSECRTCSSMNICNCFIERVVEFNFNSPEISVVNIHPHLDDKLLSGYESDCWQPPELV